MNDPDYSATYKRFVLTMLTIVYAFNFIDRQILVILQESIKADIGFSDAQLGLLSGFSFALVYVTAGIPIVSSGSEQQEKYYSGGAFSVERYDSTIRSGSELYASFNCPYRSWFGEELGKSSARTR